MYISHTFLYSYLHTCNWTYMYGVLCVWCIVYGVMVYCVQSLLCAVMNIRRGAVLFALADTLAAHELGGFKKILVVVYVFMYVIQLFVHLRTNSLQERLRRMSIIALFCSGGRELNHIWALNQVCHVCLNLVSLNCTIHIIIHCPCTLPLHTHGPGSQAPGRVYLVPNGRSCNCLIIRLMIDQVKSLSSVAIKESTKI